MKEYYNAMEKKMCALAGMTAHMLGSWSLILNFMFLTLDWTSLAFLRDLEVGLNKFMKDPF